MLELLANCSRCLGGPGKGQSTMAKPGGSEHAPLGLQIDRLDDLRNTRSRVRDYTSQNGLKRTRQAPPLGRYHQSGCLSIPSLTTVIWSQPRGENGKQSAQTCGLPELPWKWVKAALANDAAMGMRKATRGQDVLVGVAMCQRHMRSFCICHLRGEITSKGGSPPSHAHAIDLLSPESQ